MRRRDSVQACNAGVVLFTTRYTTHLFASIVTSIWNISSLHGSLGLGGLVGSIGLGGLMGRLGFRVGVRVRFSISVGVSVVDGK